MSWVYLPGEKECLTNSDSSRVLAESPWDSKERDLPLQHVLSKSMDMRKKFYKKDGLKYRFGMMSLPSTEKRETLISSAEDFLVRISQLQEKVKESNKGHAPVYGLSFTGSLAKYDPSSQSLRTFQCSLFGEEPELLQTLPKSGTMLNGVLYQQKEWEPITLEKECLSWPTPRSCTAMAATITKESAWKEGRSPNLETVVGRRMWPTPRASIGMTMKMTPNMKKLKHKKYLETEVAQDDSTHGGLLNPTWVEWLMGFPLGWTDLNVSATQLSRNAQNTSVD